MVRALRCQVSGVSDLSGRHGETCHFSECVHIFRYWYTTEYSKTLLYNGSMGAVVLAVHGTSEGGETLHPVLYVQSVRLQLVALVVGEVVNEDEAKAV